MDTINNYNLSLLQALHSWFWYNGLLDQVDDEWVDFEKDGTRFSRPKYDENCVILKLTTVLQETDDAFLTLDYLEEKLHLDMFYDKELNVLWLLLVKMFGDYGTSPRSGWIEKRSECANFLETVVEIEELVFFNSKTE
jgi:hypothetical protein